MTRQEVSFTREDATALLKRYETALDAGEETFSFVIPSAVQSIELFVNYCYYLLQYLHSENMLDLPYPVDQLRKPPPLR